MIKIFTIIAIILFPVFSMADATISVGVGKGVMEEKGTPFERMLAVGYEHALPAGVFVRPEAGWFMDISGNGKSSAWAAPLLGVRAQSQVGPELHIAMGPGWLQNPDQVLGGHFQFSLEGGAGLSDKSFFIGLVWKHLSSAGFEMPNQGRDFITVQLRILAI